MDNGFLPLEDLIPVALPPERPSAFDAFASVPLPVPDPRRASAPILPQSDLTPVLPAVLPVDDLVPVQPQPAPTLGQAIETSRAQNEIGFFGDLKNSLGSGMNDLDSGMTALLHSAGLVSDKTLNDTILTNLEDQAQYPNSVGVQQGLAEIMGGTGFTDTAMKILQNPRAVLNVAARSLPASVPAIVGGLGGGLAGSLAGPIGATAGAAAGAGVGSAATEYGSSIVEALTSAGVQPTRESIQMVLNNPEAMAAISDKAALRAAVVGLFDAAGGGLAGKVLRPVAGALGKAGVSSPIARAVGGSVAEAGVQGTTGALGEAGAQLATEGKIVSPGAVGLEAAAEIPSSALEVPGAILAQRKAARAVDTPPVTPPGVAERPDPNFDFPFPASPPAAPPSAGGGTPPGDATGAPPAPVAPPAATPAPSGNGRVEKVRTPELSMQVDATHEVVDMDALKTASGDYQPRDRSRAASEEQIAKIGNAPDPSLLMGDPISDRGAPIVDETGMVLSGNGRFMGLKRAADTNPAGYQGYVDGLKAAGYNVDGMARPVLVRRVAGLSPSDKIAFALKSNASSSLGMSPGENARVDALAIDDNMLGLLNPDTEDGVQSAANTGFVRAFMGKIDANRRAQYVDKNGGLLPAGADAVQNALFSKAYDDENLLQRIVEEAQGGATRNALLGAAPAWAQMRAGAPAQLQIADKLTEAMNMLANMRQKGMKPADFLAQTDAFNQPSPEAVAILKLFYNEAGSRAAAWRDTRDFLREYAKKAMDAGKAGGNDLVSGKITPMSILNEIAQSRATGALGGGGQGGLFGGSPVPNPPTPTAPVPVSPPAPPPATAVPAPAPTPQPAPPAPGPKPAPKSPPPPKGVVAPKPPANAGLSPKAEAVLNVERPKIAALAKRAVGYGTASSSAQGKTWTQTVQGAVWIPAVKQLQKRIGAAKASGKADEQAGLEQAYSEMLIAAGLNSATQLETPTFQTPSKPFKDVIDHQPPVAGKGPDLDPEVVETTRKWAKMMGLGAMPVILRADNTWKDNSLGKAGTARMPGNRDIATERRLAIATTKVKSKSKLLAVIAHELGHFVQTELFDAAPKDVRDKIIAEYEDWLRTHTKPGTTHSALAMAREPIVTWTDKDGNLAGVGKVDTKIAEDSVNQGWVPYAIAFDEWFAEQTTKWVLSNQKALTPVDKFFQQVADMWRKAVALWKGQNPETLPRPAVVDFLSKLTTPEAQSWVKTTTPSGKTYPDGGGGRGAKVKGEYIEYDGPNAPQFRDPREDTNVDDGEATVDELLDSDLEDRIFGDASMSTGLPPATEMGFRAAGVDPNVAVTLAPVAQVNLLSKVLKDTFGISVVDKGNIRDTLDQLLDAARNLGLMVSALGLPEKALGLGDTLTLGLIRRTKNQGYFGRYSPSERLITLPGRSNSFAHEWAHALDHWLMTQIGPQLSPLLSEWTRGAGLDKNTQIKNAFVDLMNALFFDDAKLAARVLQLQVDAAETVQKGPNKGAPTQKALTAQRMLRDIDRGSSHLLKERSRYYRTSQAFDGGKGYFTNPAEMLARAFEAFVAHSVGRGLAGSNQFVSKTDEDYLSSADLRFALTFPKGAERDNIFMAINQLMDVLRTEGVFGSTTAATAPVTTDVIDTDRLVVDKFANGNDENLLTEFVDDIKGAARAVKNIATGDFRAVADALREASSENVGGGGPKSTNLSLFQRIMDKPRAVFFAEAGHMWAAVKRNKGRNAALKAMFFMWHRAPGSGETGGETFSRRAETLFTTTMSKIGGALKEAGVAVNVPVVALTSEAKDAIAKRLRVTSILIRGALATPGATKEEITAAANIRRVLDQVYRDARKLGLDIGYVRDGGYMPRILDMLKIYNDPTGFMAKAEEAYGVKFDKELDTDPGSFIASLQPFMAFITGYRPNSGPGKDPTLRALMREFREAMKSGDTNRIEAARDAVIAHVRPLYTAYASEKWYARLHGGNANPNEHSIGPDVSAAEARELPIDADDLLNEYYERDPVALLHSYVQHMSRLIAHRERAGTPGGASNLTTLLQRDREFASKVRAAGLDMSKPADRAKAITTLTNPATTDRVEMLAREAVGEKANPEDIQAMRNSGEFMSGRTRDLSTPGMRKLANGVYAYGSIILMGRAAWASLVEPLTLVGRQQGFRGALAAFGEYVTQLTPFVRQGASHKNLRAVAELIGLVADGYIQAASQNNFDTNLDGPVSSKIMNSLYQHNLVRPLTNAQYVSNIPAWHWWLKQTLSSALDKADKSASDIATAELKEMGLDPSRHQEMKDWLDGLNGRHPTPDDLKGDMGKIWGAIIREGAFTTIQSPDKGTKPRMASSTWGRLVFGLTSFSYTFARNIFGRSWERTKRDAKIYVANGTSPLLAGAFAAVRNGAWLAGGMSTLFVGQFLVTMLRESLFNAEEWKRREKEGKAVDWLFNLALSRTGVFGPFDPINQAITGVKYQRDLTALTAGPFISLPLSLGQSTINYFQNNSKNTNNTEYALAKDAWRTIAAPILAYGILAAPGGSLLKATALQFGTSNKAADDFAQLLTGEKDSTVKKRERERVKQMTPAEQREYRRQRREERRKQKELANAGLE
jgi:hypothetical protein